jgi:selenide,water dikinase
VTLTIEAGKVPVFNGVLDITSANRSGGLGSNQDHFAGQVALQPGVDADRETILYDPQTSGGLLVAVRGDAADRVEQALAAAGVQAVRIGAAAARQADTLIVVSP